MEPFEITKGSRHYDVTEPIPGEWYDAGGANLIRIRRNSPRGRKWAATIYVGRKHRGGADAQVHTGRTVLGVYPTSAAAVQAAMDRLAIDEDPERVCDWKDVVEARKERKRLIDAKVKH